MQNLEEIEESENRNEEKTQEEEQREEARSRGSSCDRSDIVILLFQKRKRRTFQIPKLSEDKEEEEESTNKRRIEETQEWSDDDAGKEEVISLLSERIRGKIQRKLVPRRNKRRALGQGWKRRKPVATRMKKGKKSCKWTKTPRKGSLRKIRMRRIMRSSGGKNLSHGKI